MKNKVILVTGAAHRVGAEIVKYLHAEGANIVLHYRNSKESAQVIADELNTLRQDSVLVCQADLDDLSAYHGLIDSIISFFGQLDGLVNNASGFYPTPVGEVNLEQWNDLMSSNLRAPFFLSQIAAPYLKKTQGNIVNIVDIHAERPLKDHTIYCMAKAGLVMMTKSLARELGPDIRVNAVAPGAILWPQNMTADLKADIMGRTALKRQGRPEDIAKAVLFAMRDAEYMTGQVLTIDGGRSLNL